MIFDLIIIMVCIIFISYYIFYIGQVFFNNQDDEEDDVNCKNENGSSIKVADEVLNIKYKIIKCEDPIFSCESIKEYIEERIYGFKHNNGYILDHRLPFALNISHKILDNELVLRAISDNEKIIFDLFIELENPDKYRVHHRKEYGLISLSFVDDLLYVHTEIKEKEE